MKRGIQKLAPPSYFARRTTEEISLKFKNKLCCKKVHFILFAHKQEWLECLSKIRCNKNEKNI
jgi:hypothetical protein